MKLLLSFLVLFLSVVAIAQDAAVPVPAPVAVVAPVVVAAPEAAPVSMNLIGMIALVVIALNAFLFGLYNTLAVIKDKTSSDVDNKAYDIIAKVLGFLQKIIEIIGPVTAAKAEKPKA